MASSVGIVIPAYRPDINRLSAYVAGLEERVEPDRLRIELYVPETGVVDALADSSATVATASIRRGKGVAITAGFERLGTDVLAFVDADGSVPPASVADVIEPIRTGTADLSVGSRRRPPH